MQDLIHIEIVGGMNYENLWNKYERRRSGWQLITVLVTIFTLTLMTHLPFHTFAAVTNVFITTVITNDFSVVKG